MEMVKEDGGKINCTRARERVHFVLLRHLKFDDIGETGTWSLTSMTPMTPMTLSLFSLSLEKCKSFINSSHYGE